MNQFKFLVLLVLSALLLFGCGEGSETNAPSVKLTASTVASTVVSSHAHNVSIPFIDVSAAPADSVYQYRSDSFSDGHSHVIALTKQQMIELNDGQQVLNLKSSSPQTGADHTHLWNIQGGSVLYEKYCYNCHSNDKRNHTPMNVSFNSQQISAVRAPGNAPISSASFTTADPNYTAAIPTALDGAALYASNCTSCHHGVLASTTLLNRTATQIRTAINSNSTTGMGFLGGLTDAQLLAIETALKK
jgi:mono/diheme cytochrome c family protein